MATIEEFDKLDIRVGRIVEASDFPEARKPAYKLKIDFGETLGIKRSSAQIVQNYTRKQLAGMLVLCVVNLPPRQIGPFVSEVLTLGVPDPEGQVTLVRPDTEAPPGGRLY